MIRIENAEIGMKVLVKGFGFGILRDMRLAENVNRVIGIVELDEGGWIEKPLDLMAAIRVEEA